MGVIYLISVYVLGRKMSSNMKCVQGSPLPLPADGLPCTYVKSWCPVLCYGNARLPAGSPAGGCRNTLHNRFPPVISI